MNSTLVSSENLIKAERWDFEYFSPEFLNTIQQIYQSGWTVKKLEEIVINLTDGQHGYLNHLPDGIPLIRTTNVFTDEIRLDDVRYISPEAHAEIKRSQLKPGDVLLVTIGVTLGVSAVVDNSIGEANINQNLVKITPKAEVNPYYLSLFFNSRFGKTQTQVSAVKSVVPIVNYARLRKMLVPIPPRPTQDKIAQVMQDAYLSSYVKLKEATELLIRVDSVVCQSLKIEVAKILDEPRFIILSSELEDRLDFKVYDKRYISVINTIEKAGYPVVKLGSICSQEPYRGIQPVYDPEGDIIALKTVNIGAGYIDFNGALRTTNNFIETPSKSRAKARKNDLLITSTGHGSWGRASVFDYNAKCMVDGHITIVRLKEGNNPFFFEAFLNSSLGQAQFWQRYRGHTGQTEIYPKDIAALRVPLPPQQIQDEIAEAVFLLRTKNKQLRAESETLITEGKARVERMILGEEEVT